MVSLVTNEYIISYHPISNHLCFIFDRYYYRTHKISTITSSRLKWFDVTNNKVTPQSLATAAVAWNKQSDACCNSWAADTIVRMGTERIFESLAVMLPSSEQVKEAHKTINLLEQPLSFCPCQVLEE